MQKSRVSRFAARMALGTGALVLCALPAILSSGSATASILDGAATITNQALSPLSSGGSTTAIFSRLAGERGVLGRYRQSRLSRLQLPRAKGHHH